MDYRATLNLPKTKFKMKAGLAQREPEFLRRWEKENLYDTVQKATADRPLYVLHDGPPYANGHIHLGTAFNKVIKDIILRSKRMEGFHCPYVPGWDCHGLPIEHNVDKELGPKKKDISKLAFRGACRKYAEKWIKTQKKEFQRLGVLGDWDNPYLTIKFDYEASIAREFNRFLQNGSVIRSKKPVYWCSSCRTALAEAEVEYYDHGSSSIYVKFPVADDLSDIDPTLSGKKLSVVIWTTTPWTLPANLAVAFHPDFLYAAVEAGDETWIMAEEMVEKVMEEATIEGWKIITTFSAKNLEGRKCRHPFLDRDSLMVLANYVTLEAGTGCVHTAPGHGREDYITGLNYGLDVLSPVDADGCFTKDAGQYAGMPIKEANPVIMENLDKDGSLLYHDSLSHSYPHCWRCKQPVIFRATEQWFISMDKNDLRDKALESIKGVNWVPKWGMDRIFGMVETRPDWCLSRQRAWGVPLTVFFCKDCGEVVVDEEVSSRIDALFMKEGADAWFRHDNAEFLGHDYACSKCGSEEFEKEEDILDVWFDSGVSYAAVCEQRDELEAPADLYLEGSDQHRGWFQSSLLAGIGTRGVPPFKSVLTHGFVVDGKGKKMSKSIGNVIAPEEIIKQYGAEILRLWVASEDYRDDIKISDEILKQLSDAYRKIRNTMRFLLGNIKDFQPDSETIPYSDLLEEDRWALHQFELLKRKVKEAYNDFEFHAFFHGLYNFCTVTMSALYLDFLKDRLYTMPPASPERKSAQTVLHTIAEGLMLLMSPVMSFTSVEAWAHLPERQGRQENIFLAEFPADDDGVLDEELNAKWEKLLAVRKELTKVLEGARRDKIIGHPLEAKVLLKVDGELGDFLADNWQTMQTIAIVSDLARVDEPAPGSCVGEELTELSIAVQAAEGEKCERCWTRSTSVGDNSDHPLICERCLGVVAQLDIEE